MSIAAFYGVMPIVADASKGSSETRIAHAKELLGGKYKRSVVRHGEDQEDISDFITGMTKKFLPSAYQKKAKSVATAILRESEKHGFDPIFVMAVIQNESRFNPEMKGTAGEIGLMQIKPSTAEWFAQILRKTDKSSRLKYKDEGTLYNPVENVKFGVAFMAYLRDQFDSNGRLYISAYNMGAKKVRDLVNEDRTPKEYVQAVMKRYVALYHAFSDDSLDTKEQTEIAYSKLLDLTRKIASN